MNARARKATPKKLSATCSTSHAPRPDATSAPGARPSSRASPTNPAASGAVNNATAEPRSRASLASCSRIRHSARSDSDGASPTTESCDTPTTWIAAPAAVAASIATRDGAPTPRNGASANAVATPYSARAIRWRERTTKENAGPASGPGRDSGRHFLDEARRQPDVDVGTHHVEHQSGGRVLARVHDHQDHPRLLARLADHAGGGLVHLEDVTQHDAVGAAAI